MPSFLIPVYFVLWATLIRALVVRAKLASTNCSRCGFPRERRELGEGFGPVDRQARSPRLRAETMAAAGRR